MDTILYIFLGVLALEFVGIIYEVIKHWNDDPKLWEEERIRSNRRRRKWRQFWSSGPSEASLWAKRNRSRNKRDKYY